MATICLTLFLPNLTNSQNPAIDGRNMYDFWIGHWEVTWDEGDGGKGQGTNSIVPILDGKALQENFQILSGGSKGFKGTSISTYHAELGQWKQVWTDNRGGYFDFTGTRQGNKRIFQTKATERDGQQVASRMVFFDIQRDSLTWDWESSIDGGKTWNLKWRIFYRRIDTASQTNLNASAPKETQQFGQFVGAWDCTVWNLGKDGNWMEGIAKWIWKYILDGKAVQDFWYGPTSQGTNIRIFDPKRKKWMNTWVENGQNTMSGIWEANLGDDGSIEMSDGTGEWSIRFYNITEGSFDWKWDFLQADGTMKTMVKIKAKRENQYH